MTLGIRLAFETLKVVAAAGITSTTTWNVVATAPDTGAFVNPIRNLLVNNFTDADLEFSIDGTNPHFRMMARTQATYDLCSDSVQGQGLWLAAGSKLRVRRIGTPTTGSVSCGGFLAKGD